MHNNKRYKIEILFLPTNIIIPFNDFNISNL